VEEEAEAVEEVEEVAEEEAANKQPDKQQLHHPAVKPSKE
jgi:hypothetical protein